MKLLGLLGRGASARQAALVFLVKESQDFKCTRLLVACRRKIEKRSKRLRVTTPLVTKRVSRCLGGTGHFNW